MKRNNQNKKTTDPDDDETESDDDWDLKKKYMRITKQSFAKKRKVEHHSAARALSASCTSTQAKETYKIELEQDAAPSKVSKSTQYSLEHTEVHASRRSTRNNSKEYWNRLKKDFLEKLSLKGWHLIEVIGDGACMFRAVSLQLFGSETFHGTVREICMDFIESHRERFLPFIIEDFEKYVKERRRNKCYGDNLELQAISAAFERSIEVYRYGDQPLEVFPCPNSNEPPLRLAYLNDIHYDAIIEGEESTHSNSNECKQDLKEGNISDSSVGEQDSIEEFVEKYFQDKLEDEEEFENVNKTEEDNLEPSVPSPANSVVSNLTIPDDDYTLTIDFDSIPPVGEDLIKYNTEGSLEDSTQLEQRAIKPETNDENDLV